MGTEPVNQPSSYGIPGDFRAPQLHGFLNEDDITPEKLTIIKGLGQFPFYG